MKAIRVLYEHSGDRVPHGSCHIRLLRPFGHPRFRGEFQHQLVHQGEGPGEIVVVDRYWKPGVTMEAADEAIGAIRKLGKALVHVLDDNLYDLKDPRANAARAFTRAADLVIVSTPALARRVSTMNDRVRCIPNALDSGLLKPRRGPGPRAEGPLVIGYMGTPTHEEDFYLILRALRTILVKHQGRVRFECVGALRNPLMERGLPHTKRLDPGKDTEYPAFWSWMNRTLRWDIGIAPLKDTPFNRCKSDIKFLDYTALGATTLCSDLVPYRDTVEHGVTGLVADASYGSWYEALDRLVQDSSLRLGLQQRAEDYLHSRRTLDVRIDDWLEAFRSL